MVFRWKDEQAEEAALVRTQAVPIVKAAVDGDETWAVIADVFGLLVAGDIPDISATYATALHAAQHTDGTDDIQDATAAQKGLMTLAYAGKLDGIEAGADVTDTANVTAAGALMDSEVDADLKTFSLPANTTISAFGATLVDDADAGTARATLDVDQAGTDNSTDVTLSGTGTYLTLVGQDIQVDPITESDISDLQSYLVAADIDTLAELNAIVGDATLDDSGDSRTPTAHASSHQSGGSDAIKLDDLSAPDDNTDLDASITAHGLLPKLPNDAATFLNGVGGYSAPSVGASDSVQKTVYNQTGSTLSKGKAVYINGWKTGNEVPTVALARSDSTSTMPALGLVLADISNASEGTVVVVGSIGGLDTSTYALDDPLYVDPSTAGDLTTTEPVGANFIQAVARVTRVNVALGTVFVAGALRSNAIPNFTAADKFWYGGTAGAHTEGDITAFARTVLDDADAATARGTLDVDQAGTDNSTDVTLSGTGTYLTLVGQDIQVDPITESDISDLGSYIEASGVTYENLDANGDVGTGAGQVAIGNHTHAQLHDRSHAMTGTSDHTATAWRVFYSDGSGDVTELALGASGTYLKSQGATSAPTFDTPGGGGDVTAAANIADNAIVRGDGGAKGVQESAVTINDGGTTMTTSGATLLVKANAGTSGQVSLSATQIALGSPDGTDTITVLDGTVSVLTASTSRIDVTDSGVRLGAANARVTTIYDAADGDSSSDTILITPNWVKTYGTVGGTDVLVADGGTGRGTATAYAVICGGTTATGAHQSIASVGTSGQVLTSNGAGALPTFQDAAGGGDSLTWDFSTTTTDSDPGANTFRYNNATPASVTFLYVDDLATSTVDAGTIFTNLGAGDLIYVEDSATASKHQIFRVISETTDGTGYWKIPVEHVTGATLPANSSECFFKVFPATRKHSASMTRDAALSLTGGASTKVAFDNEEWDYGGIADEVTNDRFDILQAGRYLVSAYAAVQSIDDGEVAAFNVKVNGTLVSSPNKYSPASGKTVRLSSNLVMDLDVNDYIEFFIYNGSATSDTLTAEDTKPRATVTQL